MTIGASTQTVRKSAMKERMVRYTMKVVADCDTDYPEPLLREWATDTLGAVRCSAEYLAALRIVLGNMARADRHGASLRLSQQMPALGDGPPAIPRQRMRTILDQLHRAGLVTRHENGNGTTFSYQGKRHIDNATEDHSPLERLYREAEDTSYRRQRQALGICVGDVPY